MNSKPNKDYKSFTPVPVTILSGFIGAGKTSLLNHILTGNHGKRIAVLVNDFGAVNIDASLIDNQEGDVVSLANGCICCSLSDGLLATVMLMVRKEEKPEHIIVETSGVADPFEVARTFSDFDLQACAPLEGIVTVVDAELAPTLEEQMLQLAEHQIKAADILVLNKMDLIDDDGHRLVNEWISKLSPTVRMVEFIHGNVPLELLFDIGGAIESGKHAGATKTAPQHDSDKLFDTFTFESAEPLSLHHLHNLLGILPNTVFRVKGLVHLIEKPDNPCVLQSTGRRATLTVDEPWADREPVNQILFIGKKGGINKEWIEKQLTEQTENL